MLTEERYQKISELLEREGNVKARELCSVLGASRETVRRDLETMEKEGILRRIHGGAVPAESSQTGAARYTSFVNRKKANLRSKEAIAQEALKFIKEGQCIALDSGTTSLVLAQIIKNRFKSLTVVTNSLPVVNTLAGSDGITLVVTGGIYHTDEEAFMSDMATLILPKINIDIFFITTCGVSVERGITYQRTEDVIVQRAVLDVSGRAIVIADSSKIGTNALVNMCSIEEIAVLITDADAPADQVEAFRNVGVEVVLSSEKGKN